MGKRFDLLVFDWDGTVVDSADHIVGSIQAAARDLGLDSPLEQRARHIIGLGLVDAMTHLFPALPPADYPRLAERYRHHYLAGDHKVSLFAGASQGIQAFCAAGFTLAVATGKSRQGLDRALERSGLASFFRASRCADEGFPKPHPDMLQYLMTALGAKPQRTLMIGDTTHDLEMARSAGVPSVAMGYGAHPRESLEAQGPLACLMSFAELVRWVDRNG
ncbi:MAG TPA: HAD-IA family hydrolase [Burkholderiales bacterium]|nr:HAD-IA family hydrolase [Burkholderiales bacterium]